MNSHRARHDNHHQQESSVPSVRECRTPLSLDDHTDGYIDSNQQLRHHLDPSRQVLGDPYSSVTDPLPNQIAQHYYSNCMSSYRQSLYYGVIKGTDDRLAKLWINGTIKDTDKILISSFWELLFFLLFRHFHQKMFQPYMLSPCYQRSPCTFHETTAINVPITLRANLKCFDAFASS